MIHHILDTKIVATATTGIAGLFAQAAIPVSEDWLKRLSELGSFGLVGFAVYMSFTKIIPLLVTYLEGRDAAFLQALKDERDSSERINTGTRGEIREIVSAQTATLGTKLDTLTAAVSATDHK